MDYIIKKLSLTDFPLAKQLITLWQTENGYVNPMVPDDSYLHALLSKDSFNFFVDMKDELVIGGLTAYELCMYKEEKTEMFLYEIGVEKNYCQKEVATKLIESLKKTCTGKDIKQFMRELQLIMKQLKNYTKQPAERWKKFPGLSII